LNVESNEKAIIDYSNTDDGYIMVKWLIETDMQLRVQVTASSGTAYTYTILPNDTFNVLPLTDGNGEYEVNVFEQVDGDRYALANSHTFNATLTDEFAPFLRPNQFVDFDEDTGVVVIASQVVAGSADLMDKIAAVYEYVINNFTYDTDFANEVVNGGHKGYLPDLDEVLARGRGICFDYAAVMSAMLRSQGVPTKLVIGYASDVYHAWISVFSEETGWIDGAIFFDGENWQLMDPTFASTASNSASLAEFIGDGSNYTVKFHY
jgi:transglutaminase-like putative cysteine protease